jgi:alpha-N-arabinofuranosidase
LIVLTVGHPAAAQEPTAAPLDATIRIDAGKVVGSINPGLYGQFAEFMFADVKDGLTAEMLRDRSFEMAPDSIGLPRYWERYPDRRNDDDDLKFKWNEAEHYPPTMPDYMPAQAGVPPTAQHGLTVTLKYENSDPRGFYQPDILVRKNLGYHGYAWVKSADFNGSLTFALAENRDGGNEFGRRTVAIKPGDWTRVPFAIPSTASADQPNACFCVLVAGKGTLTLDQLSLEPDDAVNGVRADTLARVKALHPSFLRWPGGNVAQDYHWMWGIGPRDQRKTWVNLSWGNEPEPSDFGTDEAITFCREVGAEPSLTVNVEGGGGTPEEAAAWVEYCNGPATSKYGAMRAANGHPEPYHVRTWEVGNEIWGDWVRGHSDAATYAANFNRYAAAMKAKDPGITLIGCGDNSLDWERTVLQTAGRNMDLLAIHHYYGIDEMKGDEHNLMAHPLAYERFYGKLDAMARELVPHHRIGLVINEWNTVLPTARQHSMESALYGARLMNVFERCGDFVRRSSVSDMVNGWSGGVIQAGRTGLFVTPTYWANVLYATCLGTQRVETTVTSPTYDSTLEGKQIPALDVVASRSADGRTLYVKAVNTDFEHALRTRLEVIGNTPATVKAHCLNESARGSHNDFRHLDAVRPTAFTLAAANPLTVTLPAHSVMVLEIKLQR